MKVTLYMATSIDGYIATPEGDSEWISEADIEMFDQKTQEADCIIVWNTTYQQYKWEIYPISWKENIVVTQKFNEDEWVAYANSPESAIHIATEKGYKNILLVWGGHINGSFLEKNLIDEVIIDIQPLILWSWIKVFEKITSHVELSHTDTQWLDWWLVVIRYTVNK